MTNDTRPVSPPTHSPEFLSLVREVAASYGLTAADVLSGRRSAPCVAARREAMLAARARWGWQTADLARAFGRHHATVAHALRGRSRRGAK